MGKKSDQPAIEEARTIETELRLTGDPETLNSAFNSPPLASKKGGEDRIVDLKNAYYDTVDQKLRAEGLALRVRHDGNGRQQTLKAGDASQAALLKRGEWNVTVGTDHPCLDTLPKEAVALLPKEASQGDLRKTFETRVQRRVRQISINGTGKTKGRIEASLDVGEIETETGTLPIAELELELLKGEPQTLYQVALDLQKAGPLQLETRSKSSRAYDQLGEQPPSWHRAVAPLITASHTVDDAMAAIFASCFGQWLANQAAAIDGRDPEGVHQMRIGLRRLRSALSVFRPLIPDGQLIWLRDSAKQTINALGPARDWDVFQSDLLEPVLAAKPDDPALRAIRTKVRAKARASYRRVRNSLALPSYTEFALRLGQWVESRGWRADADPRMIERHALPATIFAKKMLRKRQKKALAAGKDFARLTAEERHDLRITLKKLRYAAEFFAPLVEKKKITPLLKSAKKLQDDLGLMNDVAVAEGLLDQLPARSGKHDISKAAGIIVGWHMSHALSVEQRLLEDWKTFAGRPIL